MPKDRRDRHVSFDRPRAAPFSCSSSRAGQASPKKKLPGTEEDLKEWEEARCPVCMEPPHNAVLLKCSSHEKGCRPYMCDTSYRHSNCLDQFRKSSVTESPSSHVPSEDDNLLEDTEHQARTEEALLGLHVVSEEDTPLEDARTDEVLLGSHVAASCESKAWVKLVCPLCRGPVREWSAAGEPARRFMNAKARSCARESCGFHGTYKDLRKHARLEHPLVRPSVADPERQRSWRRLERQREIRDLLSTLQSSMDVEGGGDDGGFMHMSDGLLTVFFLIRVFRGSSGSRSSSWPGGGSRARMQARVRRRSPRLWGEPVPSQREEDDEGSDTGSGTGSRPHRIGRWHMVPENEP